MPLTSNVLLFSAARTLLDNCGSARYALRQDCRVLRLKELVVGPKSFNVTNWLSKYNNYQLQSQLNTSRSIPPYSCSVSCACLYLRQRGNHAIRCMLTTVFFHIDTCLGITVCTGNLLFSFSRRIFQGRPNHFEESCKKR